jgi:hypothetical protein
MNETAGIEYKKDAAGNMRYVQIDLNMYGEITRRLRTFSLRFT